MIMRLLKNRLLILQPKDFYKKTLIIKKDQRERMQEKNQTVT